MAHTFFRIRAFITYWLDAVDEHSLHSPYLFDFYTRIIMDRPDEHVFAHIEKLRQQLLKDNRTISVRDLGASEKQKAFRKISRIARTSLSRPKCSILYNRIINYFNANTIIELGTSFGINTLYLAEKKGAAVTTFEGSPAIAGIAELTFEFASKKNVQALVMEDFQLGQSYQNR